MLEFIGLFTIIVLSVFVVVSYIITLCTVWGLVKDVDDVQTDVIILKSKLKTKPQSDEENNE